MRSKLTLDDQFNELMEASDLAQDERTLKQAIKNFANAAGFERFAYLNVRAGNTHALSNYPGVQDPWKGLYTYFVYHIFSLLLHSLPALLLIASTAFHLESALP